MDIHDKLDEVTDLVENARAMPMSASCIVHRGELLSLLDELRDLLPEEFAAARAVVAERETLVEHAHDEARAIIDGALAERDRLLSDHEVVLAARERARRIVEEARARARRRQLEADEYVDTTLANLEVTLSRTLTTVRNGRDRLGERADADEPGSGGFAGDGLVGDDYADGDDYVDYVDDADGDDDADGSDHADGDGFTDGEFAPRSLP